MNKSFYPKLAFSNIKKNAKTYVPYILMGVFIITMFYMMLSIVNNEDVHNMKGADLVVMLINIGVWVVRIFGIIFLFYINSFLMKRRKKEIGLYNILGMEKRHIGIIMVFETIYVMIADIVAGITLGIVFSKMMFLALIKLIGAETIPKFEIQMNSIIHTVIFFGIIFLVILVYNIFKVYRTKPIELLHGGEVGEKEPKTKVLLTIIGIAALGGGYYFALTANDALHAMSVFFLAVLAVIVGTYCLFTAGSISILKLMRKNKKFYYKSKHFTSVSGMIYRMKQNAIGLANICILSTMVLISVATSVSMYMAMEDSLNNAYPNELCVSSRIQKSEDSELIDTALDKLNQQYNAQTKDVHSVTSMSALAYNNNGTMELNTEDRNSLENIVLTNVYILDEFNMRNKTNYTLNNGEVLVYADKTDKYLDTILFAGAENTVSYKVKEYIDEPDDKYDINKMMNSYTTAYYIIVKDAAELDNMFYKIPEFEYEEYSVFYNTNLVETESVKLDKDINDISEDSFNITSNNKYNMRKNYRQLYGGFLFIGLFVGVLFSMATALIIYYKQISEGYDDKERFAIMQKVGMSHSEVKKAIHSQVLTVFILPLAVATVHVIASFKIIKQILTMLMLDNTVLFGWCTVATVLVFALVYGIVFAITTRSYYKITKF